MGGDLGTSLDLLLFHAGEESAGSGPDRPDAVIHRLGDPPHAVGLEPPHGEESSIVANALAALHKNIRRAAHIKLMAKCEILVDGIVASRLSFDRDILLHPGCPGFCRVCRAPDRLRFLD